MNAFSDNDTNPAYKEYEYSTAEPSQPTLRPHRGGFMLGLGLVGITACMFVAPLAWYLSNRDLNAMDARTMDPAGETLTNIGRVLGIVGTGLLLLQFCIFGSLFYLTFAASQSR